MPEPVDYYLGFDSNFFYERDNTEMSTQYARFLNQYRDLINGYLLSTQTPTDKYPADFTRELKDLAKNERKPWWKLQKDVDEDRLLELAGIAPNEGISSFVIGRIQYHLARLMFPLDADNVGDGTRALLASCQSPSGTTFTLDYLAYATSIVGESSDSISEVLGADAKSAMYVWKAIQYVHLGLREAGYSQTESMRTIFEWLRGNKIILLGLEDDLARAYHQLDHLRFDARDILGFDERMPTHLRARMIGKILAVELAK